MLSDSNIESQPNLPAEVREPAEARIIVAHEGVSNLLSALEAMGISTD